MSDFISDADDIKETDIVFDCPECGKSLAIDYRGAGLTIPCSDCGNTVEVPIPDGMELADLDSSAEEQEMRILNLRRSLSDTEARVRELDALVDTLRAENGLLREGEGALGGRMGALAELFARLQQEHLVTTATLARVADVLRHGESDEEAPTSDGQQDVS